MDNTARAKKAQTLTIIGLVVMTVMILTKLVPSLNTAGYSVFAGIAFFFIVEAVAKTPQAESGLRFKTLFADLKKPGVWLWVLLPVVSAIVTLIVGNLIFGGEFVAHVMGRTGSILSFDKLPLLVGQVVVAALGEEIAFRGFFVGKSMKLFPFRLCAVVSSALFACAHIAAGSFGLVFFDVATIFIDAVIYAVIYKKSGNCLVSTLSHILCNAAGIAATLIFFV
ncbi:MAG: type II CAAX endopeptidase family protein [Oscillospiraceae bacterium]|nr:type II CAAX endopeptidase family protein [Oscillospiraceae bacterium]